MMLLIIIILLIGRKERIMSKNDFDYMFKVILIGSSAVGKSNILLKFTRNQFNEHHQSTIGVEFAAKNVEVNDKNIRLQIWDTLGQQQYQAIMKTFYKGASAAFLTYDITSEKSFTDLDYWLKQIKEYSKNQIIIMLVGNKSDLEENRQISKQKGLQYAEKHKLAFYEVSAKDGTNIGLIFMKIAQELAKIMEESEKAKKQSVVQNPDALQSVMSKNIVLKKEDSGAEEKKKKKCCN